MIPTLENELRRYIDRVPERDAVLISRVSVPGRFEREVTHFWSDISEDEAPAVCEALRYFGSSKNNTRSYTVLTPSGGRGEELPGLWRIAAVRASAPGEPHGVYRIIRSGYATEFRDDEARIEKTDRQLHPDEAHQFFIVYPAVAPESLDAFGTALLARDRVTNLRIGRAPIAGEYRFERVASREEDDGTHSVVVLVRDYDGVSLSGRYGDAIPDGDTERDRVSYEYRTNGRSSTGDPIEQMRALVRTEYVRYLDSAADCEEWLTDVADREEGYPHGLQEGNFHLMTLKSGRRVYQATAISPVHTYGTWVGIVPVDWPPAV